MTSTKQEISDKLRVDKNHICRARNDIDSALAWISGIEIIDFPDKHKSALKDIRDRLDWYAKFLTNDVIDPESVYVHNLSTGNIDKDSGIIDEAPGAYKDFETVMESQRDLVEIVTHLQTLMCVKG